jgi:hypothetical protein
MPITLNNIIKKLKILKAKNNKFKSKVNTLK